MWQSYIYSNVFLLGSLCLVVGPEPLNSSVFGWQMPTADPDGFEREEEEESNKAASMISHLTDLQHRSVSITEGLIERGDVNEMNGGAWESVRGAGKEARDRVLKAYIHNQLLGGAKSKRGNATPSQTNPQPQSSMRCTSASTHSQTPRSSQYDPPPKEQVNSFSGEQLIIRNFVSHCGRSNQLLRNNKIQCDECPLQSNDKIHPRSPRLDHCIHENSHRPHVQGYFDMEPTGMFRSTNHLGSQRPPSSPPPPPSQSSSTHDKYFKTQVPPTTPGCSASSTLHTGKSHSFRILTEESHGQIYGKAQPNRVVV